MMEFNGRKLGWSYWSENRRGLRETGSVFRLTKTVGKPVTFDSPPAWVQIEDQNPLSSCRGHSGSSNGELCNWIKTKGSVLQFSRMYAYLTAQRKDGIRGDNGATIFGGIEAYKETGFCLEETMPYTGQYDPEIPTEAIEEGKQHRLLSHVDLKRGGYALAFDFLASGAGGIDMGIMIDEAYFYCNGVLDRLGGKRIGGHAFAGLFLSSRTDSRGRHYIWSPGSWGLEFGKDGWIEIAPTVFDQWCRDPNNEIAGTSDIEDFGEPRAFDWLNARLMG